MRLFSDLVVTLGSSTKTNEKLEALADYFSKANAKDKVWVIAIFSGRRPKRAVNSTQLFNWCAEIVGLPIWLMEESYHTVGDLGETIALLLPEAVITEASYPLHHYLEQLTMIDKEPEAVRKEFILSSWNSMTQSERFVFNKLITGSFRIGVSQKMMVNALSRTVSLPSSVIAHRISGNWNPMSTTIEDLLSENALNADHSKPYPFYLAYALEEDPSALGEPADWQAEWKWDGIRGQIIKRNNELFVWSRGEELMTDKFPEYDTLRELLPEGVVLDGEIIPSQDGKPLPFALLQTRIGRKNLTKKQLLETPITFFVYDLLEYEGRDFRESTLIERRTILEK